LPSNLYYFANEKKRRNEKKKNDSLASSHMTGQVKMCKNGVNPKPRDMHSTITGLTITEKN
jgi:hypothetical protein